MIQNADDAGASVIQFYVDKREHDTSGLVKSELTDYNYHGPALLSSNDVEFTEKDWKGIQSLQQSIKVDDPFKVGRFGIGFNSVYHLTGKYKNLLSFKPKLLCQSGLHLHSDVRNIFLLLLFVFFT